MVAYEPDIEGDWAHLGDAMRLGRRLLRLTQAELAQLVGVDRKTISNYETGRVPATAPRVPEGYYLVGAQFGWERRDVERLLLGIPRSPAGRAAAVRVLLSEYDEMIRIRKRPVGVKQEMRKILIQWEVDRLKQEGPGGIDPAYEGSQERLIEHVEEKPARPLEHALKLYPAISRFARICVANGADPQLRDSLEDIAEALIAQAADANHRYGIRVGEPDLGWGHEFLVSPDVNLDVPVSLSGEQGSDGSPMGDKIS